MVGALTLASDGVLQLDGGAISAHSIAAGGGGTILWDRGELRLTGGNVTTTSGLAVPDFGLLVGHGSVDTAVSDAPQSTIQADGGNLTLGDATSFSGFNHTGTLEIGATSTTLRSLGFAQLGVLTRMEPGGVLIAANGITLGVGDNFQGAGTIRARVAQGFGSSIQATGDLTLGEATAVAGFTSDGELDTGTHTVTIDDANEVVLGSLTQLNDGTSGGTLAAGTANPSDTFPHFFLEEGKNLLGRGEINGNFKNNGHVIGDAVALSEWVIFNSPWIVKGKGTFENTLVLGTFSPGDSPGVSDGSNQAFGGIVQIELGGPTPGEGAEHHDQIIDRGTLELWDESQLHILPFDGFLPGSGQQLCGRSLCLAPMAFSRLTYRR